MFMTTRPSRTPLRLVLTCMPLLVLAATVTGCGTGGIAGAQNTSSTGGTPSVRLPIHSFTGTMTVFHLSAPYTLPGTITMGPDGNLWFPAVASSNFGTSRPSGAIGRMTPAGVLTLFALPTLNSYPRQITRGSDGNLWFTALQGSGQVIRGVDTPPKFSETMGEIGVITPSGTFGRFLPGPSQANPDGITSGPDGNLWFTETVRTGSSGPVGKIGRITPSGTISEFPLPTPGDAAPHITAGPDGNLWFTIQSSQASNAVCKIGRITPQGAITTFSPAGLYIAGDITSGPDGNLWFSSGYYVTRIAPDGKVTEYSLPGQGYSRASAGGIIAGSDGALWFATNGSYVGRAALDGAITQYAYSSALGFDDGVNPLAGNELKGITTAADGTLWLTDDDKIGHFT